MKKTLLLTLAAALLTCASAGILPATPRIDGALRTGDVPEVREAVRNYFSTYRIDGYTPNETMRADSLRVEEEERRITVFANEAFCAQPLTPSVVRRIHTELSRKLPPPYNTYRLAVCAGSGQPLEDFIPNILREDDTDRSRLWGDTEHKGNPLVTNASRPYEPTRGLNGRHLFISASHGRYHKNGTWRWQRPRLFCTMEDIFTQSFVNPFLVPMLEHAGAIVVTARERDMQTACTIVDNDLSDTLRGSYSETVQPDFDWRTVGGHAGFAPPAGNTLADTVAPFANGTARYAATTSRRSRLATATWTPRIPRDGRYAVYVSYASLPNSVSDARYTVYHKGGRTTFRVNQQMGGGTWVYLGTFDFAGGEDHAGRVVLTNQSNYRGVVTADGVRFGGGMGMVERGEAGTSALPRFLEAARYNAQWNGLPDSLYRRDTLNDYADDIRTRPFLLNYLAGGSCYRPAAEGLHIPLELSLALHSDAGVRPDASVYGTLAICTTQDDAGSRTYSSGLSRGASLDFCSLLLESVSADLTRFCGTGWTRRELWDRNYGETRLPDVPSAILEMLSHQNFTDLRYGHDPNFKFAMARAIYKAVLRYVSYEHGIKHFEVQPLPVHGFAAILSADGTSVRLSWQPTADSTETSAQPSAYIVYTRNGDGGFDNGTLVEGHTSLTLPVTPGRLYSYRVSAVNKGGESFPSETLCVYSGTDRTKGHVLIVNGFERLSGPAQVNTPDSVGFVLRRDIGVPYIADASLCGEQLDFTPPQGAPTRAVSHGYSGDELEGHIIAGNTFDYPAMHGAALAAHGYTFSSCSREHFAGMATDDSRRFRMVDYIAGLERDAPQNLRPYKALPPAVRSRLAAYLQEGGSLFLSGAYVGSDLLTDEEKAFAATVLKYSHAGTDTPADYTPSTTISDTVNGLNLSIPIRRTPSADGIACPTADVLVPATGSEAFPAFAYSSGQAAGTAYAGPDGRTVITGFPFEAITSAEIRAKAMGAIARFLME